MIDPTAAMFATQETRRLNESARPGAPRVVEQIRPARGPGAGSRLAAMLRSLADRVDGGQARVPSRMDVA